MPTILKSILFLFFTLLLCSCENSFKVDFKPTSPIAEGTIDIAKIASTYRSKFLSDARYAHTATLLSSGKVVVFTIKLPLFYKHNLLHLG